MPPDPEPPKPGDPTPPPPTPDPTEKLGKEITALQKKISEMEKKHQDTSDYTKTLEEKMEELRTVAAKHGKSDGFWTELNRALGLED